MSKYEFIQCCKENKEIELEDGARRIFFNTRGYENEKDEDIKAILKYINGEKVENSFVKLSSPTNDHWEIGVVTLDI